MTVYRVLDPHPKEIEQWEKDNYLPDKPEINQGQIQILAAIGLPKEEKKKDPASDRVERIVHETRETGERPIKREVHKIFRVMAPDREYLYYVQQLTGQTFSGKVVDIVQKVGKYTLNVREREVDRATGAVRIGGVRTRQQVYEIPYAKTFLDPSTGERMAMEELGKFRTQNCKLYARVGEAPPYEMLDMQYSDFITKTHAELIEHGKSLIRNAPVPKA